MNAQPASPKAIARDVSEWFKLAARDLPWRRRRSGYRALVAEFMLQQTQVSRVIEQYDAFMRRFPRLAGLAAARGQSVLAAWRGLGYYGRARRLHAAAKLIVGEHGGRVPRSAAQLRALPGVGRYTAGAIASIVFGERTAIVDGNVQRVLNRVYGHVPERGRNGRTGPAEHARWTWGTAQSLVDAARDPGVLNEGLMELGAVVCLPAPAAPRCGQCPLARHCTTFRAGRQASVRGASRPKTRRTVHHHTTVIMRRDRRRVSCAHRGDDALVLLQRRPGTGMWADMWQAPTIECDRELSASDVKAKMAPRVHTVRRLGRFVHDTTHRRIVFHVFSAKTRARGGTWCAAHRLDDLPMSNAQKRALRVAGMALGD